MRLLGENATAIWDAEKRDHAHSQSLAVTGTSSCVHWEELMVLGKPPGSSSESRREFKDAVMPGRVWGLKIDSAPAQDYDESLSCGVVAVIDS